MAGGPKFTIGIDDSVQSKVQELEASLKQARKDVRELEKEAKKAIESTGKVSDFALKRIDEAKRKAADINSQLRGARALGPRPEIVRTKDDRPTARDAMRNFKDLMQGDDFYKGVGRRLAGTRLGGAFGRLSSGLGAASEALSGPGAAYGAFAKAIYHSADRNLEAENLERSVRLGRLIGQDTDLMQRRLDRSKIEHRMGYRFTEGVADELNKIPVFGGLAAGIVRNLSPMALMKQYELQSAGADDFSLARKELEKSDVSFREYRRAQVDADGNSIKTLFMDKLEGMSPEPLRKFLAGGREQETLAKVKEYREQKAKYEAQGYALVDTNNFAAAQDAFNNAAHFGANKAIDAIQAWQQGESSMRSRLEYEKSQRKVPAYRMNM